MSIFLCYSRIDDQAVRSLTEGLGSARREVWFDHHLDGGDAWWDRILENIRRADVLLFALSDYSLQSKPCRAELEYAEALGLAIVPVQIGPVAVLRGSPFADRQIVTFRADDAQSGFKVVAAIDQAMRSVRPRPVPLPPAPPIPYAYLVALGRQIASVELDQGAQLTVVDQLRRALGDEADQSVRYDIFTMLEELLRKPWTTRRTEKEIRALLYSYSTSSLITETPDQAKELQPRKVRSDDEVQGWHDGASSTPLSGVEEGPLVGASEEVGKRSRRHRSVWVLGALGCLLIGIVIGVALAPHIRTVAIASGPPATAPTESGNTLPASTPLGLDDLIVPIQRDGKWELDLGTTRGPGLTTLLAGGRDGAHYPVLSPDRRTVIYVNTPDDGAAGGGEKKSLRVAAVDGSGDRALFATTPPKCSDVIRRPAWNPVDPTILAISCRDSEGRWTLNLVHTDGSIVRSLDVDNMKTGDATWNADGSMLAFWGENPESGLDGGAIYVFNGSDGSGLRRVTKSAAGQDGDPAWNRAGDTLAYRHRRAADPSGKACEAPKTCVADLYTVRIDSTPNARVIVKDGLQNSDPAWSPETNDELAYVATPLHPTTAARVRLLTLGKTPHVLWPDLDRTDDTQNAPAWSRR